MIKLEPGYYWLDEPVENPKPDRRQKYAFDAKDTFPAGLWEFSQYGERDVGFLCKVRRDGETSIGLPISLEQAQAVAAHLRPYKKTSIATVLCDGETRDTHSILVKLLEMGRLSLIDVKDAIDAIDKTWDEDAGAYRESDFYLLQCGLPLKGDDDGSTER